MSAVIEKTVALFSCLGGQIYITGILNHIGRTETAAHFIAPSEIKRDHSTT